MVNFLVGKDDHDEIGDDLLAEAHQHQDMIIGDFHDTYRNLAQKYFYLVGWVEGLTYLI